MLHSERRLTARSLTPFLWNLPPPFLSNSQYMFFIQLPLVRLSFAQIMAKNLIAKIDCFDIKEHRGMVVDSNGGEGCVTMERLESAFLVFFPFSVGDI